MKAVVIGAGAFGGWTAYCLQQGGVQVTLIDARGPGNSQSSSGGETRIVRAMYGAETHSTRMAARAIQLWKQYETLWQTRLFCPSGMLLMAGAADDFVADAKRVMRESGVAVETLTVADASRRFPQMNFEGIDSVLFEPGAGIVTARETCRLVVDKFVASGGEYRTADVSREIAQSINADAFVFACGPWLPKLFPDLLKDVVRPSRQDVFFFGVPAGQEKFSLGALPVWADRTSEGKYYGIPNFQHRGFKIAADLRGPEIDPDKEDRIPDSALAEHARTYIAKRFSALRGAPIVETRVCQYENTPDFNFIIDRHPEHANTWIVGGGSGHGYKHGPALGEYVAKLITENAEPDPTYRLDRFRNKNAAAPLSSF